MGVFEVAIAGKPNARDLGRFVEVLHQTGDCVLAYRAMRPTGRLEVAERRAPELAALSEVQVMLEELAAAPEALADDERMRAHALSLADDPDLTPRERLEAIKTYDRLRKSVSVGGERRGGFAPELRAFLTEQGVVIDGLL